MAEVFAIAVSIFWLKTTDTPEFILATVVPGLIPTPVTRSPTLIPVVEATLNVVCPAAESASQVVASDKLDDVSKSKFTSAILMS